MAHLVVDISGHGFGHAGQVLPLVRHLLDSDPGLRVTLRSPLPAAKLREILGTDCATAEPPPDIGMHMHGPMEIDVPASAAAYAELHRDWDAVVAREAQRLAALQPDLLLADIPYSSLAAAAHTEVPAIALCSLNWGLILDAYCGDRPGIGAVVAQVQAAYESAAAFLQPRPHAPMPELGNARSIGPVCRQGRDHAAEVRARLGVAPDTRLALAAFGGIQGRLALGELPRRPGLVWLRSGASGRDDVADADALGLPFCDLAASVDLVITKVGYGTLCETLAAGTRLLLVERPGWPESEPACAFARAHGAAASIDPETLAAGTFGDTFDSLMARPRGAPMPPTGLGEAAYVLAPYLSGKAPIPAFD